MENDAHVDMKQSLSILLFSVFGFDLDDLENEGLDPLEHLINKAYIDATNQGAFNTQTKGQDEKRNEARDNARNYLSEKIYGLQSSNNKDSSFDMWHKETCKGLVDQYESSFRGVFTYGNAQKWVNMTLKYADMLIPIYSELAIDMPPWMSIVKECHNYLHAPVDSYVIEAVWEKPDNIKEELLPLDKDKRLKKDGAWGKYSSEKVKGWSSWGEDEYLLFHNKLGSIIKEPPIEWEVKEWTRIAKLRNKRLAQ